MTEDNQTKEHPENPSRRAALTTGAAAATGLAATAIMGRSAHAQTQQEASGVLAGKTAFITGGARGIGQAVAIAMAEAGANIAVYDVLADFDGFPNPMANAEDLTRTREGVEATGRRFEVFRGDIRSLADQQRAISETESGLGPIDILVANAGVNTMANMMVEDQAAWDLHWEFLTEVNTLGTARTLRAALPGMVERGQGSVIVTASTFSRQGNAGNPGYVASKWGTAGLIKSVAIDVGKSGVTVNGVAPTAVRTGLGGPQTAEQRAAGDTWLKANYHALDEGLLEPADVAGAYVYLASDAARMVTGSIVDVSAGAAARYTA